MKSRLLTILVALACVIGLCVSDFGASLLRGDQFAYRDSSDFYYPLYQRVQQEWEAGRLPLWSPEENAGMPLLGNPTAAVLYPGKLIYAILPYPKAARVYVVAHVILAFLGMLWLLRHWDVSEVGSAIGGLSYAFGAPVLDQYCNVIFLVGAAWMPMGLLAADQWVRLGRVRAIAGLAVVLAMQVLGGDPEAAYFVAIATAGYALGLATSRRGQVLQLRRVWLVAIPAMAYVAALGFAWWSGGFDARKSGGPQWLPSREVVVLGVWVIIMGVAVRAWRRRRWTWGLEARLYGLAGACALALALSGVQLIPVLEFMSQSLRATGEGLGNNYAYSLHPLQLAAAIWPNFFGTFHQGNHNWMSTLPPGFDHQVWFPSLYVGGSTLILAFGAASFRTGPPWRIWLTCLVVVGVLASLGQYGSPLFWARRIPALASHLGPPNLGESIDRGDGLMPDGDGGVYWLFSEIFPGFRSFRYPAKMLIPACLGISGLAGIGWDAWIGGRRRRIAWFAAFFAAVGILGALGLGIGRMAVEAALTRNAELAATSFGPLDTRAAFKDLLAGSIQGALAASLTLVVIAIGPRRPALAGMLALAVLSIDLAVANTWTVITIPQSAFDTSPRVLEMIRKAEREHPATGPFRVHRMRWSPTTWVRKSSAHRAEEIVRWERDSLRPKYGLPLGLEYTQAMGTTELVDYAMFFDTGRVQIDGETARGLGMKPGQSVVYHTRRGFDLWGSRYFILPARLAWNSVHRGYTSFLSDADEVYPTPTQFDGLDGARKRQEWLLDEDVQVLFNRAVYPRAWVVHRARFPRPIQGSPNADRAKLMGELLFQNDELWRDDKRDIYNPKELAWVETDAPRDVSVRLSGSGPDPADRIEITRYESERVEMTATLGAPGLVILADVYYPGWELTIDDRPAEILRTNRMMRGALVTSGKHRLVYTYQPLSLKLGAMLSIVGVLGLGVLTIASRQQSWGRSSESRAERLV